MAHCPSGRTRTNVTTIPEILARVAAEQAAWREPHDRAILARAAMLAIHRQAFCAALCARELGLAVGVAERAGDGVELSFRGGIALFRRGGIGVWLLVAHAHRTDGADHALMMPESVASADEWAESQVADALRAMARPTTPSRHETGA